MNRRNFLKKIGTICVTTVVAPAALMKARKFQCIVAGTGLISYKDPSDKWHNYYKESCPDSELIRKFEQAFWETDFNHPFMERCHEETNKRR